VKTEVEGVDCMGKKRVKYLTNILGVCGGAISIQLRSVRGGYTLSVNMKRLRKISEPIGWCLLLALAVAYDARQVEAPTQVTHRQRWMGKTIDTFTTTNPIYAVTVWETNWNGGVHYNLRWKTNKAF